MKKTLYLIFLVAAAIVIGGIITEYIQGTEMLDILAYSRSFTLEPMTISIFGLISFTFGFSLGISVAQILMLALIFLIYYKTAPKMFP